VWSLHGLHECLMLQGKADQAQEVGLKLDQAMAGADVTINASCYCRNAG
jgi:hypothetical protein